MSITSRTVLAVSLACLLTAGSTDSKSATQQALDGSDSPINRPAVFDALKREGSNLIRQGRANTNLLAQTPPRTCRLRLTPAGSQIFSPPNLFQKAETSVGLLGIFAIKGKAISFEGFSSGFFLTESGAFAICRHSLEKPAGKGYVVMTRDGRFWPVSAVLALGASNDVAIVQVEGGGFTPLAVTPDAPVGSAVWVLGHPEGFFYTFTAGMVSGYIIPFSQHRDPKSVWMTITADYAVGSSGAPVLNENGAVVGVASETKTIFSESTNKEPQMVLKLTVPSAALLNLVQPE